jgi:hypothetical protein
MKSLTLLKAVATSVLITAVMTACDRDQPPPAADTPTAADERAADTPITTEVQTASAPACAASASWVNNPNPPDEIPGGGENFCQFYQFSWQWFLYLMSPSAGDPSLRNFQVQANYPLLQVSGDSCSGTATKPVFFVRVIKDPDDSTDFIIPERINQAGDQATIYDQNGNVVFYSIVFGRDLCTAPDSGDLPADTMEIKMAWRVIDEADKANYVWMEADVIPDNNTEVIVPETLGLVGYHLVRGTAQHPELVWATFEHKNNVPDCLGPPSEPAGGWSFLSASCAACLSSPDSNCFNTCKYNVATKAADLMGTPSEICRVFSDGTAPGDNKGAENVADVDALNDQLVGPDGILSTLPASNPMAVLANYFNVGALWVSDPSQPATSANQRGSLQLANATMETTFQGTLTLNGSSIQASTSGVVNCFGCHNYTPGQTATTHLSHIFDDIVEQRGGQQP